MTLPDGARLLHIGPHKTGTTSLQSALWRARPALLAHGVRHIGRNRNPSTAVRAIVGQSSPYGTKPPPISDWQALVREFQRAHEPRVVVSSEFFAYAEPTAIRSIVDDLDPERVHIAVTLRPLLRVIPSMWQQNVQAGAVAPFDEWLDRLLAPEPGRPGQRFWWLQRHDRLIDRWADVLGVERVTAIVVDDRDPRALMGAFEGLLRLPNGTLSVERDAQNRSLTLPEAEAIRAFNAAFEAEGLPRSLHARTMRFGAAQVMKRRTPPPDEPGVRVPEAALERVAEIQREIVANIESSGVEVIGGLGALLEPAAMRAPASRAAPGTPPAPAAPGPAGAIPPDVAASMAMGILEVSGVVRQASVSRGPFQFAEPVEVARVPTYQLLGAIVLRAWRAAASPFTRGPRAVRHGAAEPDED